MADSRLDKEIAMYGEISEDSITDAVEIIESQNGVVTWDNDPNPQLALNQVMQELRTLVLYVENQSDGPTDLLENVLSTLKVLTGERL